MDPMTIAALAGAAAQTSGGLLNSIGQVFQNRKSRQFSREMYERQFNDNIRFWNMQNEYNSPQSQMNRFQAAGLNPNLIYGQGNSGPAGAISTPDVQAPQFRNPEFGSAFSGINPLVMLNAIYDLDIKAAQTDNLKAQNTVILQDAMLKAAQTEAVKVGGEKTLFGLELDRELRPISAEMKREQLRQLKTSVDISLNRDAREAAMNASNLKEAVERMKSLRQSRAHSRADIQRINASIALMEKDGVLKQLDIELRREGINPHDPMWARIIARVLNKYFGDEPR